MTEYVTTPADELPATTRQEERKVIFASSLGTVFEWYDFFLYGALAAVISKQFFAGVNDTTAFIFALWPSPPASWCARSGHWCSVAWAT